MIAVLLLVSVLTLAATVALLPMVEGLFQTRRNAEAAQKSHLVMGRVVTELMTITTVVSGQPHAITYDFIDPAGANQRRRLAWGGQPGSPLTLNDVLLSDDVREFSLQYYATPDGAPSQQWWEEARLIEITYGTVSGGDTYTNRVRPRNITGRP